MKYSIKLAKQKMKISHNKLETYLASPLPSESNLSTSPAAIVIEDNSNVHNQINNTVMYEPTSISKKSITDVSVSIVQQVSYNFDHINSIKIRKLISQLVFNFIQFIAVVLLMSYGASACNVVGSRSSIKTMLHVFIIFLCVMLSNKIWILKRLRHFERVHWLHKSCTEILELFHLGMAVASTVIYCQNKDCIQEKDLINSFFVVLLVFTWIAVVPFLIAFCVVFLYVTCCFPRIIAGRRQSETSEKPVDKEVLSKIVSIPFDASAFDKSKECTICIENFKQTDMLSVLPCDLRHYFHTKCIKAWLKKKRFLSDM